MILKKYNINLLYYYIIRRAKFSRINRDCGKKTRSTLSNCIIIKFHRYFYNYNSLLVFFISQGILSLSLKN